MSQRHGSASARIRAALRRWLRFSWLERLPQLDPMTGWRELFTPRRPGPAARRAVLRWGLEVLESREVANDMWNMVLTGVGAAGVAYLPTPARVLVRGWECVISLDAINDISAMGADSIPKTEYEYLQVVDKSGNTHSIWCPSGPEFFAIWNILLGIRRMQQ